MMPRRTQRSSGGSGQPQLVRVRRPPVLPPPLLQLPKDQALIYLEEVRDRLKRKQARELAYLDRRTARGVYTPTDEAYENDQQLEAELLFLLSQLHDFLLWETRS